MNPAGKADDDPCSTIHSARGDRKRLRSSTELDYKRVRLNGRPLGKNGFHKHDRFDVALNNRDGRFLLNGPSGFEFTSSTNVNTKMQLRSDSNSNIIPSSRLLPDTIKRAHTRSKLLSSSHQTDLQSNGESSWMNFEKNEFGKNGFFLQPKQELKGKALKSPTNIPTSEEILTSTEEGPRQSCCAGEVKRPVNLRLFNNHTKTHKCRWVDCSEDYQVSSELARHVKDKHVQSMIDSGIFFCLWNGCKVYNRPSCSHKWLVKHMYAHIGNRPFKCVIDGCELAFATQNGLARHVPSHFGETKTKRNSTNACVSPPVDQVGVSPSRKRRKPKWYLNRRAVTPLGSQPDGFDQLTMDYIKEKLLAFEASLSKKSLTGNENHRILPQVYAKRRSPLGREEVLVDFQSSRSKEKQWVLMSDFQRLQSATKHIFCLPNAVQDELYIKYFSTLKHRRRGRRK